MLSKKKIIFVWNNFKFCFQKLLKKTTSNEMEACLPMRMPKKTLFFIGNGVSLLNFHGPDSGFTQYSFFLFGAHFLYAVDFALLLLIRRKNRHTSNLVAAIVVTFGIRNTRAIASA